MVFSGGTSRLRASVHAVNRPGERGRYWTRIRRWNIDVSQTYSPLPPSSPPAPSLPTQVSVATSSQPRYQADFSSGQPDENQPARGPVYVKRDTPPSDDDLFGLLAAEKKLKTIRQPRTALESSRAPGGTRAPLGTFALDEVPSVAVSIPDRLPTAIPSDDDHNIDDRYLDVEPVRPSPSHLDDSDELEDDDKENVPTDDYDLHEDRENMRPPHLAPDDLHGHEDAPPSEGSSSEMDNMFDETENSIAPILLASARKTVLLESLSSSSGSPTHALRTPHKYQSAHHRSPPPTPHSPTESYQRILGLGVPACATSRRAPSSSRRSCVGQRQRRGKAVVVWDKGKGKEKAAPSKPRQPLATLEYEDPYAEPPKVAGKNRTPGVEREREKEKEKSNEEDSDPKAELRRLEALLPKRLKQKAWAGEASGSRVEVETKGEGKGKGRENVQESTESGSGSGEEHDSDSSPPTPPQRAARERGRGRGGVLVLAGEGAEGGPAHQRRTAVLLLLNLL